MAEATLKAVIDYFRQDGDTLKQLRDEWTALPDTDKAQLRAGIGDGTFTY